MMNPVPWLQMTNMISYQGLVRTFPKTHLLSQMPLLSAAGGRSDDDYIQILQLVLR
ncbi:hypothetical protein MPUCK001_28090 [Citrobacter koseri]|nr:hypothetical protein MPUCK001_28090 [Citrobacter koseri]